MGLKQLTGTIDEIIFRNESNNFTVMELAAEDKSDILDSTFVAVGAVLEVRKGDVLKLSGEWIEHNSYGRQFKISTYEKVMPTKEEAIIKYLSSGFIPGIGPKTAKKIVEEFGKDTISVIENSPERLSNIKSLTWDKIQKIAESFKEQSQMRKLTIFLQELGLGPSYAVNIYKKLGDRAEEFIRENPYSLVEYVNGIGFKTADNIAKQLGVDNDSIYRIKSGILYALSQAALDGNTFLPKDVLSNSAINVLNIKSENFEFGLKELLMDGKIKCEKILNKNADNNISNEIDAVYLFQYLKYENFIASKLYDLSTFSFKNYFDSNEEINMISKEIKMQFADKQKLAISESLNNGVLVITGGPGTGKTTTINAIIKIFQGKSMKVELAAPTGRAAKRMTQATGIEAKTIHRLLEMGYSGGADKEFAVFTRDEGYPLECDVLIIDETSMVDVSLMNSLLRAIPLGIRLILVGDSDQLPSVGPGNVLHDLIDSGKIKVVILDEVFRQAQESMIVVNAHRINSGGKPDLSNTAAETDFFFVKEVNPQNAVQTVCDLCSRRLPDYKGYDALNDIQVIAPMKKGISGVAQLNLKLQDILNCSSKYKEEIVFKDTIFRVGDKVMQVKNNYDIEWWLKDKPLTRGTGVFNGDFGIIEDIDIENNLITVLFDSERLIEYNKTQFEELELAYAVTVHKSQGSEFKLVIIPLLGGPPMIMNRNLLYTAVTRAKEMVVIVGNAESVYAMVENNYQKTRYSGLDNKIICMFESNLK